MEKNPEQSSEQPKPINTEQRGLGAGSAPEIGKRKPSSDLEIWLDEI